LQTVNRHFFNDQNLKILKKYILIVIIGLTLFNSCEQKKDNPEILKTILTDYFDGIKAQDINKLNALTTSDFLLFENGHIWTNDSLVNLDTKDTSVKRHWTFDFIKVEIDDELGDMVYYNNGNFVINDTLEIKPNWLESATFKKINGQWKLKFLHSTIRK